MAGSLIRGQTVASMAKLKKSLKRGSGNTFLFRVPDEGAVTVRFLTEPVGNWVDYYEHYNKERNYFPCIGEENDCPGCEEGLSASRRYLANVVDVSENKVVPLVMPKTLASDVMKKYDKFNTLLDRDYEITRTGSGFDTEYDVTPEPPRRMRLTGFEELDLWAILEASLGEDTEDDEEDEPKENARAKSKSRATTKAIASKGGLTRRTAVVDDDDDDDDEDEKPVRRLVKKSATKPVLKKSTAAAPKRLVRH